MTLRRGVIFGDQLGINPETLRNWVSQAEIDEGHRPGVTTVEGQRIADLEREVKELRRANEILKTGGCRTNRLGRADDTWVGSCRASRPLLRPAGRP